MSTRTGRSTIVVFAGVAVAAACANSFPVGLGDERQGTQQGGDDASTVGAGPAPAGPGPAGAGGGSVTGPGAGPSTGPTGGGSSSGCAHSLCEPGPPLDPACDPCVAALCAEDAFCCDTEWDGTCVNEVADHCPDVCGGGGGGGGDPSGGGGSASATTSAATSAASTGAATTGAGGAGPGCAHDPCDAGRALDPSCDPCASDVCAADPYCCDAEWDSVCVDEAESMCGVSCGGGTSSASSSAASTGAGGGGGPTGCAHDTCVAGEALDEACDPCAAAVCALDPYCCSIEWDSICVSEVDESCAAPCGGGAGGGGPGPGPGGGLPFGSACTSDADCATGLCFSFMAKGTLCTMPCQSAADCPPPSTGCNGMGVCKVP